VMNWTDLQVMSETGINWDDFGCINKCECELDRFTGDD
jgi:hypothetical protein